MYVRQGWLVQGARLSEVLSPSVMHDVSAVPETGKQVRLPAIPKTGGDSLMY